jgi:hypothetical protein
LKRREEKEENNQKERYKNKRKKEKSKTKLGRMVRFPEGSAKLRSGRGAGKLIFHSLCGPVERKKF